MKKLVIIASLPLFLTGCFDDLTEQQEFINQVRANASTYVEPLPPIKEFTHFPYSAEQKRSPFVAPKPEVIQDRMMKAQNCLHPDPRRRKETLERYPLENVQMRGTMGDERGTVALIAAPDGSLHMIGQGGRMGLYNGKVTKVADGYVELLELIPDGAGCWKERLTRVDILEAGSDASKS